MKICTLKGVRMVKSSKYLVQDLGFDGNEDHVGRLDSTWIAIKRRNINVSIFFSRVYADEKVK
jgi:hypothetical protein